MTAAPWLALAVLVGCGAYSWHVLRRGRERFEREMRGILGKDDLL